MDAIEIKFDLTEDFTKFKVVGKINAKGIHEWIAGHYAGTVTLRHLWDLTQADLSDISTDDIAAYVQLTKKFADKRQGGKSAFVCHNPLEFGLCRMGGAYSEIEKIPIEYQTFRSLDQARKWLGIGTKRSCPI